MGEWMGMGGQMVEWVSGCHVGQVNRKVGR